MGNAAGGLQKATAYTLGIRFTAKLKSTTRVVDTLA